MWRRGSSALARCGASSLNSAFLLVGTAAYLGGVAYHRLLLLGWPNPQQDGLAAVLLPSCFRWSRWNSGTSQPSRRSRVTNSCGMASVRSCLHFRSSSRLSSFSRWRPLIRAAAFVPVGERWDRRAGAAGDGIFEATIGDRCGPDRVMPGRAHW
jgi:hypothetical protein